MRVASKIQPHALDMSSSFVLAVPDVLSSIRPFIIQGATRSDRVSDSVFVFTWELRVLIGPVLAGPAFHVRFLVWRYYTRLPATALTDILENSSVLSPYKYSALPKLNILYDRVWQIDVGDSTSQSQVFHKIFLEINSKFLYEPPNLVTNGVLQWGLHQNTGASINVAVEERINFST